MRPEDFGANTATVTRIRVEDLYDEAVEVRADLDADTEVYRLLDDVVSKLSEALRIARDA